MLKKLTFDFLKKKTSDFDMFNIRHIVTPYP